MRTKEEVTQGTIYKRGGIYWLEYRVRGERIALSLKTRNGETATAKRKAIIEKAKAGLWTGTDYPLESLAELARTSYTAKGRPATLVEVERTVKLFVASCPAKTLSGVTRAHVDAYVAGRRAEGVRAKTINKELDLLRATMNRLHPGGVNPFSKYGRLREDDSQEVPALPTVLVAQYLAVARGWVRDQLAFLGYIGCRPSTMALVRVGDVRLQTGIVRVQHWKTVQTVRDRYVEVPIPEALRGILRRLVEGRNGEELLFERKAKNGMMKALKALARRHKLPPITRRQLRHTWATQSLGKTGDIRGVMEVGGWRNMKTLQRYAEADMAARRRVVESVSYEEGEPTSSGGGSNP